MTPRPFTLNVSDAVLTDLRARLERVRWPDEAPAAGWQHGTSLAYMKELVAYWRDRYDWRAHEAQLNRLPQFTAPVGGIDIHFIHAARRRPDADAAAALARLARLDRRSSTKSSRC